ncbi:MAG: hypothetical protein WBA76_04240 [Phormidesmis sp.]
MLHSSYASLLNFTLVNLSDTNSKFLHGHGKFQYGLPGYCRLIIWPVTIDELPTEAAY